nr:MAG TPA: hypothetical protein [Caudoviricetes sp.]
MQFLISSCLLSFHHLAIKLFIHAIKFVLSSL